MMPDSESTLCPVPQEQRPINEYEALKSAWILGWAALPLDRYGRKLGIFSFGAALLASPIAAASFPPAKYPLSFSLATLLGLGVALGLLVLRIFLGWFYIADRLRSERVTYEESGWYDGQTWPKPPEALARDRLIVQYQVNPILRRLRATLGGIFALLALTIGALALWAPDLSPGC
jgi:hypothetical protein